MAVAQRQPQHHAPTIAWLGLIVGLLLYAWPSWAQVLALPAGEFIILESDQETPPRLVAGNPDLLDIPACPASTFKIILAWAALERGIIATDTRLPCRDPHLGSATRRLDLGQALLYSSNAYFQTLAPRIGRPALDTFLRESGYLPPDALRGWLGKDWSPVVKGGRLRISPRQQHVFLTRLLNDEIAVGQRSRPALLEALRWPVPRSSPQEGGPPAGAMASPADSPPAREEAWEVFGKTGAAGGAVWFIGFSRRAGRWKAVTVFCRGPVARRPAVIAAFYERFGLRWDPALLPPLP
ncbi:MAG: hypothetical protein OZSIB_2353 [Candidatus Ozemobacter sibiricus]|jgi:beta-lactamase class D|uniref:Penicillin-binding protein transpeptidase domain-containing protein n=1 Tax=Candidatus Ozemobacter sibiricus TaxID=2268124 RepID=A0A367ZSG9_9BACT|nr:MAG: hypothetical protein OZSIB_2353 [Candidatus Ozemobacter sibiricus]